MLPQSFFAEADTDQSTSMILTKKMLFPPFPFYKRKETLIRGVKPSRPPFPPLPCSVAPCTPTAAVGQRRQHFPHWCFTLLPSASRSVFPALNPHQQPTRCSTSARPSPGVQARAVSAADRTGVAPATAQGPRPRRLRPT